MHKFFDQLIPFHFRNAFNHLNPLNYLNHLNHDLNVDFSRSLPYFVPQEREFHSQTGSTCEIDLRLIEGRSFILSIWDVLQTTLIEWAKLNDRRMLKGQKMSTKINNHFGKSFCSVNIHPNYIHQNSFTILQIETYKGQRI